MSYTRFERVRTTIQVTQVEPNRGLLAVIDTESGYVTPHQPLTAVDWGGIDVILTSQLGLKKKARRAAMAARWGDSITFLEALYRLEDTR